MQILRKTNLKALAKAHALGQEGVIALIERKGLEGRGGAAFPTGKKWRTCHDTQADERFVVCNADEGEPGTFKDKFIILNNPKTMIEGILIAAYAIGAKRCFIYLRGEYEFLRPKLQRQVKSMLKRAKTDVTIEIVRGAGAYICGESTALLQSLQGNRGTAMSKPPNPTRNGLWGKPTMINNVETLTCAAQAVLFDNWKPEVRLFSLSGNIQNPGVYEFPIGVKMSKVIKAANPKRKLKAVSFGCFGGIMPVDENMAITPETLMMEKCHHGAYSIIFADETNNVVDLSLSIAKFYTYESCGKCTPCREGTVRMLNLLRKIHSGEGSREDLPILCELANHIQETALCGLGQTCGNHVLTSILHFPQDYEAYFSKK
ncbi:MAG: NADH-quinone oxidoreductase subunit F [Candidatus Micrarchaeota archaeon]|nr:NADH-quinone oxidoreductase subunit F [Candidatus Micrarchaeota archaeon]